MGPRSDFSKPCQGAAEKSANATRCCCLAHGFQRVGMSTVEAVNRNISWLFCFVSHGCTVFARSVFSMSDDVGHCIALQSVPFLHQVSSARRSFAFISGSASFALLVLGQCADPLDHGVLQKLLLIYSIPRACYTKISTLFTHRFCETVVF